MIPTDPSTFLSETPPALRLDLIHTTLIDGDAPTNPQTDALAWVNTLLSLELERAPGAGASQ